MQDPDQGLDGAIDGRGLAPGADGGHPLLRAAEVAARPTNAGRDLCYPRLKRA